MVYFKLVDSKIQFLLIFTTGVSIITWDQETEFVYYTKQSSIFVASNPKEHPKGLKAP